MLSQKLLELRKSNNLSQNALAEKLHVSRQAISRWETGKTVPDIETLKQLSVLYNVSLDELTSFKSSQSTSATEISLANHTYINAVLLIFATIASTVLPFISIGAALFTISYLFIHRKNKFCKLFIFITVIFLLVGIHNTFIEVNYWSSPGSTTIEQVE
ncbi:MAG: helix-turn-helix transcriptional regulator [Tyzzerella sp.]|nr:helix-turn-helix transcriptional regulator [Tyzzerella sp.]